MRLLQINTTLNWGSTGRIAEQIGAEAHARGWKNFVAYCGLYRTKSHAHQIKMGSKPGYRWHKFMSKWFDRHGLASSRATKKLIKKIKDIKPDIIHLHNIHGYFLNYRVLFNFLNTIDTPIVWTLHDCWSFTGRCSHFDTIGCDKWKTGCRNCPQKRAYPKTKYIDNSRKNYDRKRELFSSLQKRITLVPVSEWMAGLVRESFLGECNVEVIRNGVDVEIFRPLSSSNLVERYGLQGHKVVLGVAAPWSRLKGLDDFIKLRGLLPKDYTIVMVGLTDEQIAALPEGVVGIRRTQSVTELAEWYSVANVFVNMTYEDTFPTTNLEAMACGTPVITYRTGGSPEAVTEMTGCVVEQGDVECVAEGVCRISALDRAQVREWCRERAVEKFDKTDCYRQYVNLYEKLINN